MGNLEAGINARRPSSRPVVVSAKIVPRRRASAAKSKQRPMTIVVISLMIVSALGLVPIAAYGLAKQIVGSGQDGHGDSLDFDADGRPIYRGTMQRPDRIRNSFQN